MRALSKLLTIITISAPLLLAAPTYAESIGYSPNFNGLALGKGITGVDYGNPHDPCVSVPPIPTSLPRSGGRLDASVTTNTKELSEALNIDAKASASFIGGSASVGFKLDREFSSSNSAVDIVIAAVQETNGSTFAASPAWLPKFQLLADSKDFVEIRRQCGDRYIQSVYNEARLYAIIHVTKDASKYHIHTSITASGQYGGSISSVKASLGTDSDFKSAVQNGAISVTVMTAGLGGFKDMAPFISVVASDDMAAIADKLRLAVQDATVVGQPVGYNLVPYPGLPDLSPMDQSRQDYLEEMKSQYTEVEGEITNVGCLLNRCDGRYIMLNNDDIATLVMYKTTIVLWRDQLLSLFSDCVSNYAKTAGVCSKPLPPLPLRPPIDALIPDSMPEFEGAIVVLNGNTALDPGQSNAVIAANGRSLLAAAQSQYPGTVSADIYALIASPYFSAMQSLASPYLEAMGGNSVFAISNAQVSLPVPGINPVAAKVLKGFPVFHADSSNECLNSAMTHVAGYSVRSFDSSCLSPMGHNMMDTFKQSVHDATHLWCVTGANINPGLNNTIAQIEPLFATLTTKFGKTNKQTIGQLAYNYEYNAGKCEFRVSMSIRTFAGGTLIIGIQDGDSH